MKTAIDTTEAAVSQMLNLNSSTAPSLRVPVTSRNRELLRRLRAAEAGIRAGDVIVEVDRRPVRTIEDFQARLDKQAKDAPVVMLVNRDGQTMYVAIPAV
jgi:S1-C subfamily serine protease